MATAIKVLAQAKPSAATLIDLYTVPAATSTTVSTMIVCNQSATATTFRISVAPSGAANTASQYIYYDVTIAGNDTFAATIGITLSAGDVIRVFNTAAVLSFAAFGAEAS